MPQWTAASLAAYVRAQGRHMSNSYVRRLCREGRIQATKLGRDWIIEDEEAQRWLKTVLRT
jgi:excisionase family DNA binding protein